MDPTSLNSPMKKMRGRKPKPGSAAWERRYGTTVVPASFSQLDEGTKKETDEEIRTRIVERFTVLEELSNSATTGKVRSLIVSGPAGIGKSYTVMKCIEDYDPQHKFTWNIHGFVRATGLYKALYEFRHEECVLTFDDADSIWFDDVSLSLLKAALDSKKRRTISWLAESAMLTTEGDPMPRSFDFEGTVIFISNLDFDEMVQKGHRLAPHLEALMSRSIYVDVGIKTRREYIVRLRQVMNETNMLAENGYDPAIKKDIMDFIEQYADRMRDLSLRQCLKLAALRSAAPHKFESLARVTCCRW